MNTFDSRGEVVEYTRVVGQPWWSVRPSFWPWPVQEQACGSCQKDGAWSRGSLLAWPRAFAKPS
jgi:hypothetical protein